MIARTFAATGLRNIHSLFAADRSRCVPSDLMLGLARLGCRQNGVMASQWGYPWEQADAVRI